MPAHGHIGATYAKANPRCGTFGFFFPDAASPTFADDTPAKVDALQVALFEQDDGEDGNISDLAPVLTYLGQFIDHDITLTAATDPAAVQVIDIFGPTGLAPQDRKAVADALRNNRTGRMDLDSVYGPVEPGDNAALNKLHGLMRAPTDRAKMRIARPARFAGGIPDRLPLDGEADLPRLGALVAPPDGSAPSFTRADFDALPDDVRGTLSKDGAPNPIAAVIGDARNDENLFVAQLHVAFLRLHNRIVDAWPEARQEGDADRVFAWAREQVTLHYQWLVIHVYLPAICEPVALQQIKASGASLFGAFLKACDHKPGHAFPMPVEFSMAAFRFGHSMVRAQYDWNSAFGRSSANPDNRGSLAQLFEFTGGSVGAMFGLPNVPENWVIDWQRTALAHSEFADRTARRIDTRVSSELKTMVNQGSVPEKQNLAGRNLKRGIRLSVPGAQACIAALNAGFGFTVRPLTKAELTAGGTGDELMAAGYADQTPLWFYVLKEAEMRHSGLRLGSLGTHLVAGTILGLLIHDPDSVWNRKGSHEGRWHPADGARPGGQIVDSIPALLRAAQLLEV